MESLFFPRGVLYYRLLMKKKEFADIDFYKGWILNGSPRLSCFTNVDGQSVWWADSNLFILSRTSDVVKKSVAIFYVGNHSDSKFIRTFPFSLVEKKVEDGDRVWQICCVNYGVKGQSRVTSMNCLLLERNYSARKHIRGFSTRPCRPSLALSHPISRCNNAFRRFTPHRYYPRAEVVSLHGTSGIVRSTGTFILEILVKTEFARL